MNLAFSGGRDDRSCSGEEISCFAKTSREVTVQGASHILQCLGSTGREEWNEDLWPGGGEERAKYLLFRPLYFFEILIKGRANVTFRRTPFLVPVRKKLGEKEV